MPIPPGFTPEAILFDCDGTLLLTADLHFEAIAKAAEAQGAKMGRDWYMSLTGMGRKDLFARFASDFALSLDVPRLIEESIAMTVALAPRAEENPPVAQILRAVSGRLPLALVTNSEAPIAGSFLAATGLADLFDTILTVDSAPKPKPAPDLYLLAAQRLDVPITRCLVLEDSAQGIEAAHRAGASCLDVREPGWADICHRSLDHMGLAPLAAR
ncbi:MAG: HAD family phosphatase [Pseudorhodobacter sp.]|nr:HAD family phosphatase [Pseudorhodobacter sp.]